MQHMSISIHDKNILKILIEEHGYRLLKKLKNSINRPETLEKHEYKND